MSFRKMMMAQLDYPKQLTASGIIVSAPAYLTGMLLGETDGLNDCKIELFNGVNDEGAVVVPATTFDASALGLNGFMKLHIPCVDGIYCKITCAGATEVFVYYNTHFIFRE